MLTVKEYTTNINHIAFDWASFTEDISLSSVPIYINRIQDNKAKKGTKLIITNLKDNKVWEGDAADRIKGQLSQLIFPYENMRRFRVFLSFNEEQIDFDELNEDLRDQATGRFEIMYANNQLIIRGRIKLLKLLGNKSDDRGFYDKLISNDLGLNFFFPFDKSKIKQKHFLSNIEYLGKSGWFLNLNSSRTLLKFQIKQP